MLRLSDQQGFNDIYVQVYFAELEHNYPPHIVDYDGRFVSGTSCQATRDFVAMFDKYVATDPLCRDELCADLRGYVKSDTKIKHESDGVE